METVLVVGSTGHIGASAVTAALRSKRNVLAVVRNEASANKLVKHVGASEGITFAEADILSGNGVQSVVDRVRAGELPAFQHVYSAAGGSYEPTPLKDITTDELRYWMNVNFESNFFAYRDTIGYLLEQNHPKSTWTLCTGASGDLGIRAGPAMTQGALFSMATAACRENEATNVRFNEVYLSCRVEVDAVAAVNGTMSASDFASVYEGILARPEIRSSRVRVYNHGDLKDLKYEKKFK